MIDGTLDREQSPVVSPLIGISSLTIHSHTKNHFNISNHSEKKVVTTKYLVKFQTCDFPV